MILASIWLGTETCQADFGMADFDREPSRPTVTFQIRIIRVGNI
jgi:hypothetical protein